MPYNTPALANLLAEGGKFDYIPLPYQIAVIVLTAFFLWSFSVARDPRGWRRLYQAKFSKPEDFSVNKNKRIDELLKTYGIVVAMAFLVADVTCFLLGVTHKYRANLRTPTRDDQFRSDDVNRVKASLPKESRRDGLNK
jgi:hypothetical protein